MPGKGGPAHALGAIWDNPIILFLIIYFYKWFFQRNKAHREPTKAKQKIHISSNKQK